MHPLAQEAAVAFWESRWRQPGAANGSFSARSTATAGRHGHAAAGPSAQSAASGRNRQTDDPFSHRGRGVATALMRAAEQLAVERGRTLLVLDTAVDGGASGALRRTGIHSGRRDSRLRAQASWRADGTMIYWKRMATRAMSLGTARGDRQEIRCLQAGAADQRAVDIGDAISSPALDGLTEPP